MEHESKTRNPQHRESKRCHNRRHGKHRTHITHLEHRAQRNKNRNCIAFRARACTCVDLRVQHLERGDMSLAICLPGHCRHHACARAAQQEAGRFHHVEASLRHCWHLRHGGSPPCLRRAFEPTWGAPLNFRRHFCRLGLFDMGHRVFKIQHAASHLPSFCERHSRSDYQNRVFLYARTHRPDSARDSRAHCPFFGTIGMRGFAINSPRRFEIREKRREIALESWRSRSRIQRRERKLACQRANPSCGHDHWRVPRRPCSRDIPVCMHSRVDVPFEKAFQLRSAVANHPHAFSDRYRCAHRVSGHCVSAVILECVREFHRAFRMAHAFRHCAA